jgi:hypothetical protein
MNSIGLILIDCARRSQPGEQYRTPKPQRTRVTKKYNLFRFGDGIVPEVSVIIKVKAF